MKLYVTYCSGDKCDGVYTPDVLYKSGRISHFVKQCSKAKHEWAVFSALHGFFFPREKKENYDLTFKTKRNHWLGIAVVMNGHELPYDKSRKYLLQLAEKLTKQIRDHNVEQIVFYGPAPKMMKCYLGVLHYAVDGCSESHGWNDLIEHVKGQSKMISIIHSLKPEH